MLSPQRLFALPNPTSKNKTASTPRIFISIASKSIFKFSPLNLGADPKSKPLGKEVRGKGSLPFENLICTVVATLGVLTKFEE